MKIKGESNNKINEAPAQGVGLGWVELDWLVLCSKGWAGSVKNMRLYMQAPQP